MAKMVFISAPYSDPNPEIVDARVREVHRQCAALITQGIVGVSPLVTGPAVLPYMDANTPTDYDYWQTYSRGLLAHSDEILVLMLPGWDKSQGVQDEIKFAEEHGIPLVRMSYGALTNEQLVSNR